jgi:hypothetical protein
VQRVAWRTGINPLKGNLVDGTGNGVAKLSLSIGWDVAEEIRIQRFTAQIRWNFPSQLVAINIEINQLL